MADENKSPNDLIRELEEVTNRLKLLETILDEIPVTLYLKDSEGKHLFANKRDLDIKGIETRDKVIGLTDKEFFKSELANDLMKDDQEIINTGLPLSDKEENFPDKDGKDRWLLTSKRPLKDENGKTMGIIGVGQDISKYLNDQDILNEFNLQLFEAESIQNILNEIIKSAIRISNTTSGIIYLVEENKNGSYSPTTTYHYPENHKQPEPRIALGEGITHQVFVTGKPIWVSDTSRDSRANLELHKIGTMAFLAVPLIRGKKKIGVFYVNDNKPRSFSPSEIRRLTTLASFAVIALEKAQLIKEKEEAQQQIFELHEASSAFIASSNSDSILDTLSKIALKVTGADWVNIILIDETGIKGAINFPYDKDFSIDKIRPRPVGNSFNIFDSGLIKFYSDTKNNIGKINPFSSKKEFKSVIGIPLKVENNRCIGVLWLNFLQEQKFSPLQVNSLELFARQGAIAYNSALRLQKIDLTQHISKEVTSEILKGNKEKTLSLIVSSIKSVIDCSSIILYVYNSQLHELEHPPTMIGLNFPTETARAGRVEPNSIVYAMLDRQSYYIAEDISTDPFLSSKSFTKRENNRSLIAIPLIALGNKVGVMFINYQERHIFTTSELEIIQTFTDYAAVTIPIAQLLNETQEHANAFESLSSISTDISSAKNIGDILEKIAIKTVELLNAIDCDIYMFEKRKGKYYFTNECYANQENPYPKPRLNHPSSLSSHIIKSKTVEPINELESRYDIDWNPLLVKRGIKSMIVAPLVIKGTVIGIVYVYFNKPQIFVENDSTILTTLANDAAIAISNEKHHSDEIEALHKIAQTIVVENSQKPTITGILTSVKSLMPDLVRADIWLINKTTGHLNIEKSEGIFDDKEFANRSLDIGEGVIGRVALKKGYSYVPDVSLDPNYRKFSKDTQSQLVIPMLDGEELIGVLNIERPEKFAFSASDIQLAIAIAELAVVAFKNIIQYSRIKNNRKNQIETIGKMAESISASSEGIHKTMQSIFEWIGILMTEDKIPPCLIELLTVDYEEKKLIQLEGWQHNSVYKNEFTPKAFPGTFSKVINEKREEIIDDFNNEEKARTRCKDSRSQMVIPIIRDENVYRILNIEHTGIGVFKDFRDLAKPIANLVLIALIHAEQYEELKKSKRKIGGRTALAWMNLASGIWYHDIRGEAATVQNLLTLAKEDVNQKNYEKLDVRFEQMGERVRKILNKKEMMPLDLATDLSPLPISPILNDLFNQIIHKNSEARVIFKGPFIEVDDSIIVNANAQWLEKALEILVNNGIEAMEDNKFCEMSFNAKIRNETLMIEICDAGTGIPKEILEALSDEEYTWVPSSKIKKGLGIGLLLAQAIAESFEGNLYVGNTSKKGTTMVFSIPVSINKMNATKR